MVLVDRISVLLKGTSTDKKGSIKLAYSHLPPEEVLVCSGAFVLESVCHDCLTPV